jgi:hypothetical protein
VRRAAVLSVAVAVLLTLAGIGVANASHTATVRPSALRPTLYTGHAPPVLHRPTLNAVDVIAGDSIVAEGNLPAGDRLTTILPALVCGTSCGQPGAPQIVDMTTGGQLISGGQPSLTWQFPAILGHVPTPTTIVSDVGMDDLYGTPDSTFFATYAALDIRAGSVGVRLMPCLVTPLVLSKNGLTLREAQRERFNNWLISYFGAANVVDTQAALGLPGSVEMNPAYDFGDGMHLNAAGVRVLASAIAAKLT